MTIYTASVDLKFLSEYELRSAFQKVSNTLAIAEQAASEKGAAQTALVNIERALIRERTRLRPR